LIGADSKLSDISESYATLHYQRDIMGRGALLLTTTTIAILLLSGCSSKQYFNPDEVKGGVTSKNHPDEIEIS